MNLNAEFDAEETTSSTNKVLPFLVRQYTEVTFVGAHQADSHKIVNAPTEALSHVAHIKTKFYWFDVFWLILVTFLTPAAFALVWFGAIPLGDAEGDFREKVVWVFLINSGTYVFFSFMLVNIFLACLDDNHPWRPFKYYALVLVLNYILQVGIVGSIVFVQKTFPALGLVAIAISLFSTSFGLRIIPHYYFDCDKDRYKSKLNTFTKILFYFAIFWIVLVGYIIANASSDSGAQGLLTLALTIITFIFKKIFLSLTDNYPIEAAMVIAGLWLENIVDLFIALAYPTATSVGWTYLVIWLTRVAENIAYLGFQFEAWFKFRVWIKGKFKSDQKGAEESDLDPDDRGHSNQHPGYRRRQMRFLAWKLLSQFSAGIFFLVNIPVLRFGQNKEDYPYSGSKLELDIVYEKVGDPFEADTFKQSMVFTAFSMFTTLCSGIIIFWWMWKYYPDILLSLKDRYRYLILSDKYFGFVLTILISNVLLAVSAVQVNNRLYFL
eukprot:g8198.t1